MNSNIRRHAIYNLKYSAKHYVAQMLRNEGYIGSDNDLLSDAMFDAYDMHIYAPMHFREFWSLMCLPAITTVLSQRVSRYENLKDYKAMIEWAHSFIIEQIEQHIYW